MFDLDFIIHRHFYVTRSRMTKIEGRGNAIQTNVVYMVDIDKALARSAKYFGCELQNFIKKYVQCYGCANLETETFITKMQMRQLKCIACGFISDVDMRDKLTTFILHNPPELKKSLIDKKALRRATTERLKEGDVADEALRKLKKKTAVHSSKDGAVKAGSGKKKSVSDDDKNSPAVNQAGESEVVDNYDVQWKTDRTLEAARQRIQLQLSAVTAKMVMLWTTEREEMSKPTKKVAAPTKNGTAVYEKMLRMEMPHEKLVAEIEANLKSSLTGSQMQSILPSLSGTRNVMMNALFEALLHCVEKQFPKEVGKKMKYLAAALQEEGDQTLLLNAVEDFCSKSKPDVMKEAAFVLKFLCDSDVLEEEYIVKWYEVVLKGANNNLHIWKNTKPIIEGSLPQSFQATLFISFQFVAINFDNLNSTDVESYRIAQNLGVFL